MKKLLAMMIACAIALPTFAADASAPMHMKKMEKQHKPMHKKMMKKKMASAA
ncbi:hypothetical protein [Paludibacterium purpuratum]|uniref:Pentapeptide MXKDX repeat protein n=1 Tax=Paludibacterium purpuratum TaxID=1144873 RepID=A0A4R7B993_9NEIS|nr:hypothetical protein [Paludibacterium purpuratum]TDR81450.1 hypothetical protein DFP86_103103 [Paludibacterium purpuratum]